MTALSDLFGMTFHVEVPGMETFLFFGLVYDFLEAKIRVFSEDTMQRLMVWVTAIATISVTIWVMVVGYRVATGQSRQSAMAVVVDMARVAFIVTVAMTMSLSGQSIQEIFMVGLDKEVNQLLTGKNESTKESIDKNLAYMQVALSAIDQVDAGHDAETIEEKNRARLLAGFGTASPPMAAAGMQLMFRFGLAMVVGLGPLFILCLIFDQTKELFRKWLFYGIGTIFSLAMLNVVVSMSMDLCIRVAKAFWEAKFINAALGFDTEGISSQAMQQGGVGLLLTMLIISVPPMAALFFNGTMGSFMTYSAFNSGAQANGSSVQRAGGASGAANTVYSNASQQVPDGDRERLIGTRAPSGTGGSRSPVKDEISIKEGR